MSKENAFVAEHSYLNELFENAQEAIVVADKDGLVLRINGEFTRLFGVFIKSMHASDSATHQVEANAELS